MEILEEFSFKKESRSRYAAVVKALVEDGNFAVRLKSGVDFPDDVGIETVQGAISQQIRNAGRSAKTFREKDGSLVVSLHARGEEPKPRKKRQKVAA